MQGKIHGCIAGWIHRWMDGFMAEWMHEWNDLLEKIPIIKNRGVSSSCLISEGVSKVE